MNIGKSLRIALLKNDMLQADLAARLGIHQSGISRLANRKSMSTETLERAAIAFGMKVSEFIALGED